MLKMIDGFDTYLTAGLTSGLRWVKINSVTVNTTAGRRGGGACYGYSGTYLRRAFDNQQTWIIGMAMKLTAYGSAAIIQLLETSTVQFSLDLDALGHVIVKRGSTTLATSTNIIPLNTWIYLEVKVTISNTEGVIEVRYNGDSVSPWISLTGQDTCSNSNEYANLLYLGPSTGSGVYMYWDDFYLCDDQAGENAEYPNNDFLGDVRVDAYRPIGNGATSDLIGSDSDSTDNYLLVDDTTPDDDTTYVQSDTVDEYDTYELADMTHTPSTIFGVQTCAVAKKDDEGTRNIGDVLRVGGVDYNGAESHTLSTDYICYMEVHEVNPATEETWTKTQINSLEAGPRVAL